MLSFVFVPKFLWAYLRKGLGGSTKVPFSVGPQAAQVRYTIYRLGRGKLTLSFNAKISCKCRNKLHLPLRTVVLVFSLQSEGKLSVLDEFAAFKFLRCRQLSFPLIKRGNDNKLHRKNSKATNPSNPSNPNPNPNPNNHQTGLNHRLKERCHYRHTDTHFGGAGD